MMNRQLYAWALGKLSRKVQVMSKRWTVINSDVSVSWCDTADIYLVAFILQSTVLFTAQYRFKI